jgi:hypothetical protein
VPELDRFDGMIFVMRLRERPGAAHFHVRYGNAQASVEVEAGTVTTRDMPGRQLSQIEAWREEHREWLLAAWEDCQAGRNPGRAPWRS